MKLLKLTSVDGLGAIINNLGNRISLSEAAINIINGDAETEGSILNTESELQTYIDEKIDAIDLSQMQENADAIAVLNGDSTVDGSVAKKVSDAAQVLDTKIDTGCADLTEQVEANESAIDVLNGDADVEGSVKNSIAAIVGANPDKYHTLKEVGDAIDAVDDAVLALVTVVADNKAAQTARIDGVNSDIATLANDVEAKFVDERAITTTAINDAVDNYDAVAKGLFFQIPNLFSELGGDAAKQATARANLNILSETEAATIISNSSPLDKAELVSVIDGHIQLDARVEVRHIDYIHVLYADNVYDTLTINQAVDASGVNVPGKFKTFKDVDNDVDGGQVYVKYVIDRTIAA